MKTNNTTYPQGILKNPNKQYAKKNVHFSDTPIAKNNNKAETIHKTNHSSYHTTEELFIATDTTHNKCCIIT